ncbi:energy transducer TonB [Aquamicrobium sp. LC103]|uniref:cell envelope integrity protein TolA n=1 Tax=Aquamicrobium sp. LC103 TaxID=1120658 RepID=UPI00063ECB0F|nr:energy transducer TonB [Aquamicrobium sp. LC103]TKT80974.1 energy transducer TonB [Aquamicrobium sp. LC103]
MAAPANLTLAGSDDRVSMREFAGWTAAGVVVLGVHAAAFWMTENLREAVPAQGGPPPAIMIDLSPEVAPAPAPEEAVAPGPEVAEDQPEPVEEPEEIAEPEPAETPPPPVEPEPVPEEVVEPQPEPEPVEEVAEQEPVEETPPEPEIVEAITPEVNIPLPTARPERPRQVAEKAPPRRETQAPRKEREPARQRPQARPSAPQAAQANQPPRASARQGEARRASVSPERWQSRLTSYLNRHKRYPRGARNRREEGTVTLSFSIDPSGRVLSASIARSSGYPELDKEVLDMVRRVSPVPAPPPEIARPRMNLAVPVQFSIR